METQRQTADIVRTSQVTTIFLNLDLLGIIDGGTWEY